MFECHLSRQGRGSRASLIALIALACVAVGAIAIAAPKAPTKDPGPPKIPLDTARCPVTSGKVSEKFQTEYKGAKLFFADADSLAEFQAGKTKYINKANLQLVATKQYRQTACPLTGRPFNKNFGITIEGTPIYLCCKNCVLMSGKARLVDQLKFFCCDEVFDRQYRASPPEEKEGK